MNLDNLSHNSHIFVRVCDSFCRQQKVSLLWFIVVSLFHTMPNSRATKAELAEREDFINQLMDLGISRARLLSQCQKRFDISRAQAYKMIAVVASDRQSEGVEVIQPKGTEALREAIGLLHSASIDAYIDGDLKELPKLTKEMRELCKSLGIGAALGGSQPHDSESVGETEPEQVDPPIAVAAATAAAKKSH